MRDMVPGGGSPFSLKLLSTNGDRRKVSCRCSPGPARGRCGTPFCTEGGRSASPSVPDGASFHAQIVCRRLYRFFGRLV